MPNEKVIYLPNGVDCCRFSGSPDEALLAALAIPRDAAVVGTVAALRPEKNLLRLLRVFGALPEELNVRLVIVGDGGERAALSKAAADLGIASRIVFAGALAEPERILRRFDVFALTSDTEQMPNSVLEAMAASRAIVATDVGDVKQMLSPANAEFVVPPQDEAAFARHLRDLLADREVRIRLGAANRERVVHEYGLERMVERYDDVFAEVLGRPQMVVGNLK